MLNQNHALKCLLRSCVDLNVDVIVKFGVKGSLMCHVWQPCCFKNKGTFVALCPAAYWSSLSSFLYNSMCRMSHVVEYTGSILCQNITSSWTEIWGSQTVQVLGSQVLIQSLRFWSGLPNNRTQTNLEQPQRQSHIQSEIVPCTVSIFINEWRNGNLDVDNQTQLWKLGLIKEPKPTMSHSLKQDAPNVSLLLALLYFFHYRQAPFWFELQNFIINQQCFPT